MADDQQTETAPRTARLLLPIQCNLCGQVWDRKIKPMAPCFGQHSPQDWETYFAAHPEVKRQRWTQVESYTPPPLPAPADLPPSSL